MTACATPTPHPEMVQAIEISSDTFQISVRGDASTDPDTLQRYALTEAADETLEAGYDPFQFADQANRSVSGSRLQPGQTLLMKMSRYPAPNPLPLGMFDAYEVMKFAKGSTYTPPQPY
jgi:hypothetical protein